MCDNVNQTNIQHNFFLYFSKGNTSINNNFILLTKTRAFSISSQNIDLKRKSSYKQYLLSACRWVLASESRLHV